MPRLGRIAHAISSDPRPTVCTGSQLRPLALRASVILGDFAFPHRSRATHTLVFAAQHES